MSPYRDIARVEPSRPSTFKAWSDHVRRVAFVWFVRWLMAESNKRWSCIVCRLPVRSGGRGKAKSILDFGSKQHTEHGWTCHRERCQERARTPRFL